MDQVEWLEIGEVFARFLPEVAKIFLTDPEVPASVNVATMLAGVYDGLVATPNTAPQYKLPMGADPATPEGGLDLRKLGWKLDIMPIAGSTDNSMAASPRRPSLFSSPTRLHCGTTWWNSESPSTGCQPRGMLRKTRRLLPTRKCNSHAR